MLPSFLTTTQGLDLGPLLLVQDFTVAALTFYARTSCKPVLFFQTSLQVTALWLQYVLTQYLCLLGTHLLGLCIFILPLLPKLDESLPLCVLIIPYLLCLRIYRNFSSNFCLLSLRPFKLKDISLTSTQCLTYKKHSIFVHK